MKNHPSLLSARCRLIDKLHNHQCHGSSNFRFRLLDVQKIKNTHTTSCSRRFRDMAIPGGGSSHYGVQRNLRMHACICRGCRGWASLSPSLSLYTLPKKFDPLWTRRLRLLPFLFLSAQRAQRFKICTAFVHKGINHLKPRFFFPFDIGHNSWTMGLSWSSLLALVEDITPALNLPLFLQFFFPLLKCC